MSSPTLGVRLILAGRDRNLVALCGDHRKPARGLERPFAMSPSEHTFACTLLSTRTHLWLYRCHQRHFGGDFLVLDRSAAPDTAVRCWVLELKRAARLRVGRLGVQLARCHRIIEQVAESLGLETRAPVPVIGSQRDVLRVLG